MFELTIYGFFAGWCFAAVALLGGWCLGVLRGQGERREETPQIAQSCGVSSHSVCTAVPGSSTRR